MRNVGDFDQSSGPKAKPGGYFEPIAATAISSNPCNPNSNVRLQAEYPSSLVKQPLLATFGILHLTRFKAETKFLNVSHIAKVHAIILY